VIKKDTKIHKDEASRNFPVWEGKTNTNEKISEKQKFAKP
jgi:hypothetical protein